MQPRDIAFFAGLIAMAITVAFGYGITKNRVDTAHDRIDALDKRVTALLATLEVKLDQVIRLAERIDERTSRERGE
jgi:hypothetical protein